MEETIDTYPVLKKRQSVNYRQIAKLWGVVIGKDISAPEVALCLHQMYVSQLISNPTCAESPIKIAETIFAFEALREKSD